MNPTVKFSVLILFSELESPFAALDRGLPVTPANLISLLFESMDVDI